MVPPYPDNIHAASSSPLPPSHRPTLQRQHQNRPRDPKTAEPSHNYTCDSEKGILAVELPGVPKENVSVVVRGHSLAITARRYKKSRGQNDLGGLNRTDDALVCKYELALRLGHDADTGAVEVARCTDGMLVVHIPIAGNDEPRRIAVG